ncbi:MAG TPA: hypothetical protein VGX48_00235 [Pyrinomonadaceae bacterium]|jgi:hypothetical protein|nr:hypothetical protein [Pyrinomonadaceae bacterium]
MTEKLLAVLLAACCLTACVADQPPAAQPPPPPQATPAPTLITTPTPEPAPTPDGAATFPSPEPAGKLDAYLDAAARSLDPRQQAALAKIPETPRRLLALRGYLRAGDPGGRWSWTDEEIARYKTTAEHAAALAEVEKVKAAFSSLNPGHALHVNTEVRSLDEQLKNWNRAESVAAAGEELLAACLRELEAPAYKEPPDDAGAARFGRFLKGQGVGRTPTIALPGLSPHGQGRAFDFQVTRGGSVIADTSSGSVSSRWDAPGWTEKLREAVAKSGARMTGPLESPREPWHYTYNP